MRQSKLFTKTRKEAPKDEVAKNAELLIRAGFVHKEMAGVYSYLPLGLRVLENIKKIVREEMNTINGQEIIMTSLQDKAIWERTDRWDDEKVDVWFKSKLKNDVEVGFAWSHEEPMCEMLKAHAESYRDLPLYVYQFQTKLRNELRAKSGIMRGREFLMKDLYSFCASEEQHNEFYERVKVAYMNVFTRAGIGEDTYITFASGGAFTEFSHEFQTLSEVGEDTIYVNREKHIAINEEVYNDTALKELGLTKEELTPMKAVETGNIFNFGRKKGEDTGLTFKDEDGNDVPVWLGSYGIGITRLAGIIVEKFADDKGMVWPSTVAPYRVHLVCATQDDAEAVALAESLYTDLQKQNVEVLYDDRNVRAGEKFADSDLIGIPTRIVVGKKTLEDGMYEVVDRATGSVQKLSREQILAGEYE